MKNTGISNRRLYVPITGILVILISIVSTFPSFSEPADADEGVILTRWIAPLTNDLSEADAVVIGTVTGKASYWNDEHTEIFTSVNLSVDEILKGEIVRETVTITYSGGEVDGTGQWVSEMPDFNPLEKTAVFLKEVQTAQVVSAGGMVEHSAGEQYTVYGGYRGKYNITDNRIGGLTVTDFKNRLEGDIQGTFLANEEGTVPPSEVSFPYLYNGIRWSNPPAPIVNYRINENTADTVNEGAAIQAAAATWSAAGARFSFSYAGATTAMKGYNGFNDISWTQLSSGALAMATVWYNPGTLLILECDMEFNDSYAWSAGTGAVPGKYDVESIALHEFGHFLMLGDLYAPEDRDKVMCGYGSAGVLKRVLHPDDIAGIRAIYGILAGPPEVTNTGASDITPTSARLNGEVISTGGENPGVYVYWGTSDGGNTPDNWDYVTDMGAAGAGPFYLDVSSLSSGTAWYYTSCAVNSGGTSWAPATANFTTPRALTIDISGNGTTEPASGTYYYAPGTLVSINATAAVNWAFDNWTGDTGTIGNTGSANTTITMDGDYTITANFVRTHSVLTVAVNGSGDVTPATGNHTYTAGTVVNIIAVPAAGWRFVSWTGDVSNVADADSANTTVTMNEEYVITANFDRPVLTIAANGSGSTNPGEGAHIYDLGATVNITAAADPGWLFYEWLGNAADVRDATTNVTMNDDKAVTAMFYQHPGLEWSQAFAQTDSNTKLEEIIQTDDRGYAFGGYKTTAGNTDAWLVKTNASGNITWERTYGGNETERGKALSRTDDGGYIIAGEKFDGADYLSWVMKMDESGNVTWEQTYTPGTAHSIRRTGDGGYIIAGYNDTAGDGSDNDTFLRKIDYGGNTTWEKIFDMNNAHSGHTTVVRTQDGGYAVIGTDETTPGNYDAFLIETDADGNETFRQTYGGPEDDYGFSGLQAADGGYIIGGGTVSYAYGNGMNAWLVKTDASGNVEWSRAYGGSAADEASCIIRTSDGGYALAGYTLSYKTDSLDAWILKTSDNGTLDWHYVYDSAGSPDTANYAAFILQTGDGGLVAGGGIDAVTPEIDLFKLEGSRLNLLTNGGGSVSPGTGNAYYSWGTAVSISATPAAGWQFVNWTGDTGTIGNINSNNTNIIMKGNYNIVAVFSLINSGGTGGTVGGGGGGGGSSGANGKTTTGLRGSITSQGLVMEDVQATSFNAMATLGVPYRTIAKDKAGNPLTAIRIFDIATPDQSQTGATIVGTVYEFGPAGATFDPPITLTIRYKESDLPEGITEEMLRIARWDTDTGTYTPIEYTTDKEANKVSAPVSHFSRYTILAVPKPAEFVLSDLIIEPAEVYAGDRIEISITVSNTGDFSGNYTCSVRINEAISVTENVTIGARGQTTLNYSLPADEEGTYSVSIGELTGSYSVRLIPASFITASVTINPIEVYAGETIDISVAMRNTGQASGSHRLKLYADGRLLETREITLYGGTGDVYWFSFTPEEAGTKIIKVNGFTGSVNVKEKPAVPPPPSAPPPAQIQLPGEEAARPAGTSWGLIFGIVGGFLALAALAVVLSRRGRGEGG